MLGTLLTLSTFSSCPSTTLRFRGELEKFEKVEEVRKKALALPFGKKLSLIMAHTEWKDRKEVWRALKKHRPLVDSLAVVIVVGDYLSKGLGSKVRVGSGGRVRWEHGIRAPYPYFLSYSATDIVVHEALHGYWIKHYNNYSELPSFLSMCYSKMDLKEFYRLYYTKLLHSETLLYFFLHPFLHHLHFPSDGKGTVNLYSLSYPVGNAGEVAKEIVAKLAPKEVWITPRVEWVVEKALEEAKSYKELPLKLWEYGKRLAMEQSIPYPLPKPIEPKTFSSQREP